MEAEASGGGGGGGGGSGGFDRGPPRGGGGGGGGFDRGPPRDYGGGDGECLYGLLDVVSPELSQTRPHCCRLSSPGGRSRGGPSPWGEGRDRGGYGGGSGGSRGRDLASAFGGGGRGAGQMSDAQWNRLEKELFGEATAAGINFDAYEDIPTETSGRDVPDAITSFDDVDIAPEVRSVPAKIVCSGHLRAGCGSTACVR